MGKNKMTEIKSWKQERLRRKRILDHKRLQKLIIKDLNNSIKQHLKDIISGHSAQRIAEITERIKKSEEPVIIAESEDYFEPLKRRLEKEDEFTSNKS